MESETRGTLRALEVLKALNRNNGASVVELNRATGISRPALYRIVNTLCKEGYLRFDEDRAGYVLTPLVCQLSDGFDDDAWITDISGPILDRLQREVIWPTDLFSFHYDRMVMRRTTRRASPWTIDRAMVGFHIPVLVTAVGRAYLAHQRPDVQLGVIDRLAKSKHPDDAPAQDRSAVVRLLRQVAKDGFATRALGFMRETSSIAVPVLVDRVARCSVAVTYINSALSTAEATRRYVVPLRAAASEIAEGFRSTQKRDPSGA